MSPSHKPLTLIILDGWGYSEDPRYNAILTAKTPVWDQLWNNKPHTLISASGAGVGLPGDQMGNSEVGHLNLGAGRVVYQEFTRISRAIRTGSFFTNRTLVHLTEAVVENNKALHIMGLLSSGGVHSHESHIHAMVELAVKQGVKKIYVHAFLDGRDTPPKSALSSIEAMESKFKELGGGQFGSLIGRYYALDRDRRWTRVAKAYNLITEGKATFEAADAISALDMAYARGETDEFVQATAIIAKDQKPITIEDGDGMIFMNFRSDRARALTEAFINPQFDSFEKSRNINLVEFVSLTEYKKDFNLPTAFPAELLKNTLGGYLATLGLRQLRIAETEKYAHVTFFLNGGRDEPFYGESRILVDSPGVSTYDKQPEMSAVEVTDKLVDAITNENYDVIICNFANADMVGHSGNFDATVTAIETLDSCLNRVWEALQSVDGEMLVTADHGNAELMHDDKTNQPHTAHTTNPVPLIYVGRPAIFSSQGSLADIAPTMLDLLNLPIPTEMSGHSLLRLQAVSKTSEED